ncbi:TonB system transport protein ExbD [Candidatus Nitrosacidococcus sp. I8]|uniref:TonB system transport protein ExbD n=1 Tax=Candidatus Nitrosacidococcus sp. I8 TaxID=2942908 RepID=UPI0022264F18|nr:TonB system transport protein ExbD [Candidatus Nitrosacidococcus sp. I8]CAH9018076.1 Biopolymer transport protein ExbD [Candidatus Nitrosacidococcus sp. I8]
MIRKKYSSEDDLPEIHEINVTPFIDVILVLLIIFMVVAPLTTVDIPVDLPEVNSTTDLQLQVDKPIYLAISADLSLSINNHHISLQALEPALRYLTKGDKSQRIFLQVDKTVIYDNLMEVMDYLRTIGYLQVALVGLEK